MGITVSEPPTCHFVLMWVLHLVLFHTAYQTSDLPNMLITRSDLILMRPVLKLRDR